MRGIKLKLFNESAGVAPLCIDHHLEDHYMGLIDHHPVIIIGHGKSALLSYEHLKKEGVKIVERLPPPELVIPITARPEYLWPEDDYLREQIRISKHRKQRLIGRIYKKYKALRRKQKLARKINRKHK